MTKRRNQAKRPPQPIPDHVAKPVEKEPPFSMLGFSENRAVPGGYHIHLRLDSFSNSEEGDFHIPMVDMLAIALARLMRNPPDVVSTEVDRVNTMIHDLNEALRAEDADQAQLVSDFNQALGVSAYVRNPDA